MKTITLLLSFLCVEAALAQAGKKAPSWRFTPIAQQRDIEAIALAPGAGAPYILFGESLFSRESEAWREELLPKQNRSFEGVTLLEGKKKPHLLFRQRELFEYSFIVTAGEGEPLNGSKRDADLLAAADATTLHLCYLINDPNKTSQTILYSSWDGASFKEEELAFGRSITGCQIMLSAGETRLLVRVGISIFYEFARVEGAWQQTTRSATAQDLSGAASTAAQQVILGLSAKQEFYSLYQTMSGGSFLARHSDHLGGDYEDIPAPPKVEGAYLHGLSFPVGAMAAAVVSFEWANGREELWSFARVKGKKGDALSQGSWKKQKMVAGAATSVVVYDERVFFLLQEKKGVYLWEAIWQKGEWRAKRLYDAPVLAFAAFAREGLGPWVAIAAESSGGKVGLLFGEIAEKKEGQCGKAKECEALLEKL